VFGGQVARRAWQAQRSRFPFCSSGIS
jgi:hypothetical protein